MLPNSDSTPRPDAKPATGYVPVSAEAARALKRNVPLLYLVRTLFWGHLFGAVMVPFFTQWGGLKLSQVFYLNAWFMLCSFLLEVPTGTVADFLGRKVSLALGGFVAAAGALVYVSEPSWVRFAIAEFLLAIAFTLHSGADEALLYDTLKAAGEESAATRILGRLEACKLLGINLGTLAGAWIGATWSVTAPMRMYTIPTLLVGVLSLALIEVDSGGGRKERTRYSQVLIEGGRYFLNHPVLRLLSLDLAITNALAWAIIWLFQPVLQACQMPLQYFGLVHAGSCLAQIAFLSQLERLIGWAGSRRRLLVVSTVIAGMAMLALAWVRWLPLVIPLVFIAFAFSLPRVTVYTAHFNTLIPSDKRATVLSCASMVRTLAIVLVNPVVGWISDRSITLALALIGGLLCLIPLGSRVEERHLAATDRV